MQCVLITQISDSWAMPNENPRAQVTVSALPLSDGGMLVSQVGQGLDRLLQIVSSRCLGYQYCL
jgi:hypothetical protein